jgi:putative ubiquitin-RnfH superfamily antitoxin RatB of RatAB toxin-antitoxin module
MVNGQADIGIEVSYAEPQRAIVRTYRLAAPATLEDALRLAAADPVFSDIDIAHAVAGVFGRVAATHQLLEEGDRVEIYRPLAADPKTARRARARAADKKGRR